MKRYLIFAAVGPFFGGLLLLFATTVASGYWTETNRSEVENFFVTFEQRARCFSGRALPAQEIRAG
jgi:hypothetical protein